MAADSTVRVVLANRALARYPEAGGMWTGFLQFPLGLVALGHDALWLELFQRSGDPRRDERCIATFFDRMEGFGLGDHCALVAFDDERELDGLSADVRGRRPSELRQFVKDADLLWNFASAVRQP